MHSHEQSQIWEVGLSFFLSQDRFFCHSRNWECMNIIESQSKIRFGTHLSQAKVWIRLGIFLCISTSISLGKVRVCICRDLGKLMHQSQSQHVSPKVKFYASKTLSNLRDMILTRVIDFSEKSIIEDRWHLNIPQEHVIPLWSHY